ncbi:hypothetical protein HKX48_008439 [Thoreauomyces humboldtii]|nr:hypothetical protein HKX48_008439 [Thoreauomyces humboldtii]
MQRLYWPRLSLLYCVLVLLFIHPFSVLADDLDLFVDILAEGSLQDGTAENPFLALDDALQIIDESRTNGTFRILLVSPGEYPVNHDFWDLGARDDLDDSNSVDFYIIAGSSAWQGTDGPTIVRGPDVSVTTGIAPIVEFGINMGWSYTLSNLQIGLPANHAAVDGNGTEFRFTFSSNEEYFDTRYLTFDNVTLKGGPNPDFDTKDDVLYLVMNAPDSYGHSLTQNNVKVKAGVHYYPSMTNSDLTMDGLDFQGGSVFIAGSGTSGTYISNSVIKNPFCLRGDALITASTNEFHHVTITGNLVTNPVHWCGAVITMSSTEGGTLYDVSIQDWQGPLITVDQGTVEIVGLNITNCTTMYPGARDAVNLETRKTKTITSDLMLLNPKANTTISGLTVTETFGPFTILGNLTVTDATIRIDALPYLFTASAAAYLTMSSLTISYASGITSGILSVNGTATVNLEDVIIADRECGDHCVHVAELGDLTIISSIFSDLGADSTVFFLERSETDENPPATVLTDCTLADINGTLFSGLLSTLQVLTSTIKGCSGASLLAPLIQSQFSFNSSTFMKNWTPGDGSIMSDCDGTATFGACTFNSNGAGGQGGVIHTDVGIKGCFLSIVDSTFTNNTAAIAGGALSLIDNLETSTIDNLILQNISFTENHAGVYGGAVFFLSRQVLPSTSLRFLSNTASTIPDRGTSSSTFVPLTGWNTTIAVLPGATLSVLEIATYDAYGQLASFETDHAPVVTIQLVSNDGVSDVSSIAMLFGQTVGVVDSGKLAFSNVRVFGAAGNYSIRLIDDSGTDIPEFSPLFTSLTISPCVSPSQLLLASGTTELECRLPSCPKGCSATAGQCVADGNCKCTDPAYEGLSCGILKSENDSVTFGFTANQTVFLDSADSFDLSVDGRDRMIEQIQAVYGDTYTVVYRDFYSSTASSLARRDSGTATLFLKFSLTYPSGTYLNYKELATASTVLTAKLASPETMGIKVVVGNLANVSVTSAGSIATIAISCLCITTVLVLQGMVFARRAQQPVQGTTHELDIFLAAGLAFLFAYPVTDTMIPTAASCRAQIWLIPLSFGLITSCLTIKSFIHYTRRKNKMILATDLSPSLARRLNLVVSCIFGLYVIYVGVWTAIESPTPVLTYAAADRFWTCTGTSRTQVGFFIGFFVLTGTNLLAAMWFSYQTILVGYPIPAMEDRLLLSNSANLIICGTVAAGILTPNLMDGTAQAALRIVAAFVVALGMSGSLLGYKAFILYGPVRYSAADDDMTKKIQAIALKSKTKNIYQNIKFLPAKPDASLVWQAVQVSIIQNRYLDLTDVDTKKGRFFLVDSISVDKSETEHTILLTLPEGPPMRLQMENKRSLDDWVKKFEEARRKSEATVGKESMRQPLLDPILRTTTEEEEEA